jgi:hypothetical protein
MEIQDLVSIIGLLGIGGIIGAYIQTLLNKQTQIELEIRQLNESKYRTILVWMRCILNPENAHLFEFEGNSFPGTRPTIEIKELAVKKLNEYYYNTFLYASDDVLFNLKNFILSPDEKKFTETAVAMRKELWKIKENRDIKLYSIE